MTPYEHLYLSDNLKECIFSVSETEWKKFFESLRQSKYQELATVANDQLTTLQGSVRMVSELEGIFKGIRQTKNLNETK